MKNSLIPWHVFREALESQEAEVLDHWLDRWGFTNDGVVLIGADIRSQPQRSFESQQLAHEAPETSTGLSLQDLVELLTRDLSPLLNQQPLKLWSYNREL